MGSSSFLFVAPTTYEEKSVKNAGKKRPRSNARTHRNITQYGRLLVCPGRKSRIRLIEQNGYHLGNVMNAFRLAVVGECKGPHMFDITEIMGKEETIKRIERAIEYLG